VIVIFKSFSSLSTSSGGWLLSEAVLDDPGNLIVVEKSAVDDVLFELSRELDVLLVELVKLDALDELCAAVDDGVSADVLAEFVTSFDDIGFSVELCSSDNSEIGSLLVFADADFSSEADESTPCNVSELIVGVESTPLPSESLQAVTKAIAAAKIIKRIFLIRTPSHKNVFTNITAANNIKITPNILFI